MRRFMLVVLGGLFLAVPAYFFAAGLGGRANEDKVAICHNGHIIVVAPAAVPAHLAHGDCFPGGRGGGGSPGDPCDCGGSGGG
jgi:hypothetical protein